MKMAGKGKYISSNDLGSALKEIDYKKERTYNENSSSTSEPYSTDYIETQTNIRSNSKERKGYEEEITEGDDDITKRVQGMSEGTLNQTMNRLIEAEYVKRR